jgi:adenosylcobinamide amidohydrolase
VINAQVCSDYARHDLDRHGTELAAAAQLSGAGVVMFTAVDVRRARHAVTGDAHAWATVGVSDPVWAADVTAAAAERDSVDAAPAPGTINIVVLLPARLGGAALLNALCTATEAKTQALLAAGVQATGTPSDAVTIGCPAGGRAEPFGGPRSVWGGRLAGAVYDAVRAGVET